MALSRIASTLVASILLLGASTVSGEHQIVCSVEAAGDYAALASCSLARRTRVKPGASQRISTWSPITRLPAPWVKRNDRFVTANSGSTGRVA
jgi:hypothetical protein